MYERFSEIEAGGYPPEVYSEIYIGSIKCRFFELNLKEGQENHFSALLENKKSVFKMELLFGLFICAYLLWKVLWKLVFMMKTSVIFPV